MLTGNRYNGMWTKDVQGVIFAILFCAWLGGMNVEGKQAEVGRLLTIEEVGQILSGMFPLPIPNKIPKPNEFDHQEKEIKKEEEHETEARKNGRVHANIPQSQ